MALSNGLRGRILARDGRGEEARSFLTAAVAALSDEPGLDTVQVMAYLAAFYSISGRADDGDVTQEALELAQRLGASDALMANLFNSRGIALGVRGRRQEAIAHFREALRLARRPGGAGAGAQPTRQPRGRHHVRRPPRGPGVRPARAGPVPPARDAVQPGHQRAQRGHVPAPHRGVGPPRRRGRGRPSRTTTWTTSPTPARASAGDRALRGDWARRAGGPAGTTKAPDGDPADLAYDAYACAAVSEAEGDASAALRHARRAAEVLQAPTNAPPSGPGPSPSARRTSRSDRAALDEVLALLDGRYDGEIPLLVRAERRLAIARLAAATPRSGWPRSRTP